MGYVYQRGKKLWIGVTRPDGSEKQLRTGLDVGREKEAAELWKRVEEKLRAEVAAGGDGKGPLSVAAYANHWIASRHEAKIDAAFEDESRIKFHVVPRLGARVLADVRPRDIQTLIKDLKAEGKLAPRTIRHVYGVLHKMFADAVADELVTVNPCVVKRGDLPKKVDKVPGWRRTAVFSHEEVEALISSPDIPHPRRVLYGLLFLGGLRFAEAAALQWSSYDDSRRPLHSIGVIAGYNTKRRKLKGVKSDQPREMPVHPALQQLLQTWRGGGWQLQHRRDPTPEDLVVPSTKGLPQSVRTSLKVFHEDLARLGLRTRRQHDARRTFISLAREDGARGDLLEVVTHGPRGNIMNIYTTFPWPALCEEVAKLRVRVLDVLAAGDGGAETTRDAALPAGQRNLQSTYTLPEGVDFEGENQRRRWDSNPR